MPDLDKEELIKWLTLIEETGPSDDICGLSFFAAAALKGYTVQDCHENKIDWERV